MTTLSQTGAAATLNFSLSSPSRYGPRIGNAILKRHGGEIHIQTPNLLTATSRGVVPHLSRDHHKLTNAIRWVNVPFETFLEHTPASTDSSAWSQSTSYFPGVSLGQHVLSMSARDPYDGREMPPNGNSHVSTYGLRGVRKLSPPDWRSYVLACQPDVVFALSDTPFTDPPYSQKRLTKSIERSSAWLSNLLRPVPERDSPLNVLVHMSGGTSVPARKAFAESLTERLFGPDLEAIKPLQTLDEGVAGYTFDLVPLRQSLEAQEKKNAHASSPTDLNPVIPSHTEQIIPLLKSSLEHLPETKLRLVNSTESPHEILRLISTVGVDLFDAHWAQRAADIGVALDFEFPVLEANGTRDIGHNLYDARYALDFNPFSSSFRGALSKGVDVPICPCAACSPIAPPTRLYHGVDTPDVAGDTAKDPSAGVEYHPAFTRAYLHHLLHTHEMSAHSLLVMHNLEVLSSFFAGIRSVLESAPDKWQEEVKRFLEIYDESMSVFDAAKVSWKEVEMARGKGRMAREKTKQEETTLGTAVELEQE